MKTLLFATVAVLLGVAALAAPSLQPRLGCGDCAAKLDEACQAEFNAQVGTGPNLCDPQTLEMRGYENVMVTCSCVCWDGTIVANRCNVNTVTGQATNRLTIRFTTNK